MNTVKKLGRQVLGRILNHGKWPSPWRFKTIFSEEKIDINISGDKLHEQLQTIFREEYPDISERSLSIGFKIDIWGMELGTEEVFIYHPLEAGKNNIFKDTLSDRILSVPKIEKTRSKPSHVIINIVYTDQSDYIMHTVVWYLNETQTVKMMSKKFLSF